MGETPEQEGRGMLTAGIIVTGIGVVFLLERLGIIPHIGDMWPLFPIIVGIALIVGGLRRDGRRERNRTRYSHRHESAPPPAPERQEPAPPAPPRDEPVGTASQDQEDSEYREGVRRDSERHDPARRGPGNA